MIMMMIIMMMIMMMIIRCDGGEDWRAYQWMLAHGGIPTEVRRDGGTLV